MADLHAVQTEVEELVEEALTFQGFLGARIKQLRNRVLKALRRDGNGWILVDPAGRMWSAEPQYPPEPSGFTLIAWRTEEYAPLDESLHATLAGVLEDLGQSETVARLWAQRQVDAINRRPV